MLNTPVHRLIPRMALPTIASMMVSSLYNLADTWYVSSLGTLATGAVGINASIDNIIMMTGSFLAMGSGSYASRLLGAKEDDHAIRVLSTCFFSAFFMGLMALIFGSVFQTPLLRLLGASDAILPYSRQYARYVLLAAPFMAGSYVLNQCLRAEGSAIYSMIGMVSGAVLNIVLDPIFIFVFGWGVAGASAATALSKLVSFSVLISPYLRRRTLLRISPRFIRYTRGDALEVIKMGSTSLFRTGFATMAAILLNNLAVRYGESVLAAISVSNRITFFLTAACLGFGQGLQPVVGYSWGAKRYDRILQAYRFAVLAAAIGISVPSLLLIIFARPVLFLFTETDLNMVAVGLFSLRVQCLFMPLHAWGIVVSMSCAGMGRAKGAITLGLSRQGICLFPILPLLIYLFGMWGIAVAQGVADGLNIFLILPIAFMIKRDLKRLESSGLNSAAQANQFPT
jgi:putative MATE family efflux protein